MHLLRAVGGWRALTLVAITVSAVLGCWPEPARAAHTAMLVNFDVTVSR